MVENEDLQFRDGTGTADFRLELQNVQWSLSGGPQVGTWCGRVSFGSARNEARSRTGSEIDDDWTNATADTVDKLT